MSASECISKIRKARERGVPLAAVMTPDPQAFTAALAGDINGRQPFIQWDMVRGWQPLNDSGKAAIFQVIPVSQEPDPITGRVQSAQDQITLATANCVESMSKALLLPEGTVLAYHGMHKLVGDAEPMAANNQAVANLREPFKNSNRLLIMLCPSIVLPAELANDVLVIDEPLPDRAEIGGIIRKVVSDAQANGASKLVVPDPDIELASNALVGVAAFPAEQAVALSLTATSLNIKECWDRKYRLIESTPGLMVQTDKTTFADVGGMLNAKLMADRIMKGPNKPSVLVLVDELDKAMAGTGSAGSPGDSTGVSQDMHGVVLRTMEDNKHDGMLLVGPPGSGKTIFTSAFGASYDVPALIADFGAAKGSYVGQSEARIRAIMKTILAIGGRRVLWLATCNELPTISPPLQRRFTKGVWFFDLLSDDERVVVWAINRRLFGIPDSDPGVKNDASWSGAEIRNCCKNAFDLGITLQESADDYIVPVAVRNPSGIENLRRQAEGTMLSAAYAGRYKMPSASIMAGPGQSAGGRRLNLGSLLNEGGA